MLRRVVLASLLLTACRESLETEPDARQRDAAVDAGPSPSCLEAQTHADLAFIEDKIFKPACVFSSCHDGTGTGAGEMNLKEFMSHAELVDVDAQTDSMATPSGDYKLVVPNQPRQSYLMFMIRHYQGDEMMPPAGQPHGDVGFMPQDDSGELPPLCVEKREAIVRWIEAGAPVRM
ncbi:MAG: hypothetical protein SFX73_24375 [Kofleriaceae bacterium]|nr:hypothetical protein [Kofleriaceae bacterium]